MTTKARRANTLVQMIRFGSVGALGTGLNLTVFYLAHKVTHLDYNIASSLAFLAAVTLNYLLNSAWTFRDVNNRSSGYLFGYLKYIGANLVGLVSNLAVLNLVVLLIGEGWYLIGQFTGIFCGMGSNFILAKWFVFRSARGEK